MAEIQTGPYGHRRGAVTSMRVVLLRTVITVVVLGVMAVEQFRRGVNSPPGSTSRGKGEDVLAFFC